MLFVLWKFKNGTSKLLGPFADPLERRQFVELKFTPVMAERLENSGMVFGAGAEYKLELISPTLDVS